VSLTRAKHHLILVGRALTLQQSPLFKAMLTLARKTPAGYAPNIQVASSNMDRLALNPRLLEQPSAGEDASDDGHGLGPAALNMRSVARDNQHSGDTGHHKRRASGASSSRFATSSSSSPSRDEHGLQEEEEDDFELDEPDDDGAAHADAEGEEGEEEVDTDVAGLSPYARQQLEERISSSSSSSSRSASEHRDSSGEAHAAGGAKQSVSLNDLLNKKRAREVEERIQRESKRPARRPEAAAAANTTDSDDGEFDMLDAQAQADAADPSAHADAPGCSVQADEADCLAHAADSASASASAHPAAPSPRTLSANIREALSRSRASASGSDAARHLFFSRALLLRIGILCLT
jgi:hypothetical protein